MKKSLWLIITGVLLIEMTILNLWFGFPNSLMEWYTAEKSGLLSGEQNIVAPQVPGSDGLAILPDQITKPDAPSTIEIVDQTTLQEKPLSDRASEAGFVPDRIVIPSIKLDAPVIPAVQKSIEIQNQWFEQWTAPDEFAAGWQADSAPLGMPGNTVLSGHHNVEGKVFGKLVYAQKGDTILVYSGKQVFEYQIEEISILREKNAPLATRQKNAEWISTTSDERLTLVTCWPKRTNTHRLVVVAYPVLEQSIPTIPQNIQ